MKAYLAFVKKEWTELFRTYKLLILLIVFLLFGLMNPLIAFYMPEIFAAAGIDPSTLGLADPTALDSFAQFFKNVGQMGLIVVVIVFANTMAGELSKGTLVNVLTKGLKRRTVVLAKFTVASITWTIVYLVAFAITYFLTDYLFVIGSFSNGFLAFFGLWLFGLFLIASVILGGILFSRMVGSLLFAGGLVVVMTLLNIVPTFQKYVPATIASVNVSLLMGTLDTSDFVPALIICGALIVGFVSASILIFDRKQV